METLAIVVLDAAPLASRVVMFIAGCAIYGAIYLALKSENKNENK